MLGNEPLPVHHLCLDMIAKLFFERFADDTECVALVVIQKILDVLQEERFWLFLFNYSGDIEKQRALGCAFKTVRPAESIFLAYACDRKRLTRKSRQQHVVIRDLLLIKFCDVADQRMAAAAVFLAGLANAFLGVGLYFLLDKFKQRT